MPCLPNSKAILTQSVADLAEARRIAEAAANRPPGSTWSNWPSR